MASPHADGPQLDMAAVLVAEGAGDPDAHLRHTILEQHEDDPPARTEAILQRRNWLAS